MRCFFLSRDVVYAFLIENKIFTYACDERIYISPIKHIHSTSYRTNPTRLGSELSGLVNLRGCRTSLDRFRRSCCVNVYTWRRPLSRRAPTPILGGIATAYSISLNRRRILNHKSMCYDLLAKLFHSLVAEGRFSITRWWAKVRVFPKLPYKWNWSIFYPWMIRDCWQ